MNTVTLIDSWKRVILLYQAFLLATVAGEMILGAIVLTFPNWFLFVAYVISLPIVGLILYNHTETINTYRTNINELEALDTNTEDSNTGSRMGSPGDISLDNNIQPDHHHHRHYRRSFRDMDERDSQTGSHQAPENHKDRNQEL